MRDRDSQKGTVLVVCLSASLLIAGLSYCFLSSVVLESNTQRARTELAKCTYIAESGAADAVANIVPTLDVGATASLGLRNQPIGFGGGGYWATVTAESDRTFTVVSNATYGRASVAIETRWGREFHPLRDYAIFSGNRSGNAGSAFSLGGNGSGRDVVNGKVYVDGDLSLGGQSELHGDAVATGSITGNAFDGTARDHAPAVAPPDLRVMRYDEIADFKVDASAPFNASGQLPLSDPRHIFVKEYRADLAKSVGFRFDNTNYFLGDPYEGGNIDRVSVSYDGNEKVYFIDGNLWVEPMGDTSRIVRSPVDGTRITVVVRGNIYFCDGLQYEDPEHDALLFIAMTDGESYTDANGNNQYDAGEPILHDDGDGVYEGPREGSGNIHFGDPNGGGLGDVHGFMYADNYFQDHVLDGTNGQPIPFAVTGFMSAGEQVRIKRDFNGKHAKMTVNFDPRVVNGDIVLPGFPEREVSGEMGMLSWRFLGDAR
ncbi:MAG TPA: hypothetical protein VFY93_08920 [Planctomycetota bacterium]|nr:hypothetical protein [Planctomycetota bacterium]